MKTKLFSGEAGAGGTRRVADIGSDDSITVGKKDRKWQRQIIDAKDST